MKFNRFGTFGDESIYLDSPPLSLFRRRSIISNNADSEVNEFENSIKPLYVHDTSFYDVTDDCYKSKAHAQMEWR
jgi:hypothetical protein